MIIAFAGALLAAVTACTSGSPAAEQPSGQNSSSPPSSGAPTSSSAPKQLALALTPADRAADVAPGEPVTVAATDGKLNQVTLTGQDGRQVAGALSPDGTKWQSSEPLGYGKTYTTVAVAQGAGGGTQESRSTFNTARPKRQISLSVNPQDAQTVGVGQPLAFYFSSAVPDKAAAERAIQINTTPAVEGAFYWMDNNEVHWRPKEFWKPGTKISINAAIYGKHLGGGVYGQEDKRSNVTIGDSVIIRADGGSHQMIVEINGAVARTIPISMGKRGHETPHGTYVVMSEHTNYVMDSSTYGVPIDSPQGYRTPVAVATRVSNSGIFYHSAPWSVKQQGHSNVSHGCINMSTDNAKWLQSISNRGDVFIVANSGGPALQSWDGLGVWQIPWEQWRGGGKR
ncbi:peptidoglycan transpeptidase precursor (ErfK-YbiS-YhnG family) [Herbihabitans rhizosphaerae]|uniref:Peptidoglycan transpeptidase (ErfK-YbiS-YhnG family) n=1 Tax=Herbihabitans rhizosphaerae TaxID=1872711 RepID=A0A4Q7KC30_9PSEU|nr:Ig-like domain-containing protein [Herbihabitans rhizosphaerae]RZS30364.1 peptidoglycan transpeptidase precursor (ErfK-YbiS-YhnG family) [Herbihabitans rhizosphaerae]